MSAPLASDPHSGDDAVCSGHTTGVALVASPSTADIQASLVSIFVQIILQSIVVFEYTLESLGTALVLGSLARGGGSLCLKGLLVSVIDGDLFLVVHMPDPTQLGDAQCYLAWLYRVFKARVQANPDLYLPLLIKEVGLTTRVAIKEVGETTRMAIKTVGVVAVAGLGYLAAKANERTAHDTLELKRMDEQQAVASKSFLGSVREAIDRWRKPPGGAAH